jgi:hypothetical protein
MADSFLARLEILFKKKQKKQRTPPRRVCGKIWRVKLQNPPGKAPF